MTKAPLLALFTDFGGDGPYCGQVLAKWAELAPTIPRVNLFANSPAFDVEAGAHLLYAYTRHLPKGTVIEAVVDPGVGGARDVCMIKADGYWFCGPANGLFDVVIRRSQTCDAWIVDWRPDDLSNTFHGRDLFAPIAADIAMHGQLTKMATEISPQQLLHSDLVSDPACRVIYCDGYGNLITGVAGDHCDPKAKLQIGDVVLEYAPRFDAVPLGQCFWHVNSNGLVEIAANQASAHHLLTSYLGQGFKFDRNESNS